MDCPEFVHEDTLKYLEKFAERSIKNSDLIITISEFSKRRIQHYFGTPSGKIVVTPIPPAEKIAGHSELTPALRDLDIQKKKYILFVGTIEPRKNIAVLLRGYEQVPKALLGEFSLVLAGGSGWKNSQILSEINRLKQASLNVIMTGYVSDDDKAALYQNAALFVFPSLYEGFGMPILEAMQYGIPTIISDIPAFHEVANDAALYFEASSPSALAKQISAVLTDAALRDRLARDGHLNLQRFDWNKNARAVRDALAGLVSKPKE
jgi:alpha-1,3-rhamnosyl/mannosyltransferase